MLERQPDVVQAQQQALAERNRLMREKGSARPCSQWSFSSSSETVKPVYPRMDAARCISVRHCSSGRVIRRMPFLPAFEWKISANNDE